MHNHKELTRYINYPTVRREALQMELTFPYKTRPAIADKTVYTSLPHYPLRSQQTLEVFNQAIKLSLSKLSTNMKALCNHKPIFFLCCSLAKHK